MRAYVCGAERRCGVRFNYTELCPLTIGIVLRAVVGTTLSEFAESALWQPMVRPRLSQPAATAPRIA